MTSKKEKNKTAKLIDKPDSDDEEDIHELSYYVDDRVKLMKEVLKIIKPKKIKSMAPECIRDLNTEELNSLLLEELLGISNKRLKYIFNGQNLDEDSSSTEPDEGQPIDIISLDDVSEDDFVIDLDSDKPQKKDRPEDKEDCKGKKIKKEKHEKKKNKLKEAPLQEDNLMSVLELLELQARARAIRSQLMLEASKKNAPPETEIEKYSDNDDVIIEVPTNEEIVITDSETEQHNEMEDSEKIETESQKKKIKLDRTRLHKPTSLKPQSEENPNCTESESKSPESSTTEKDTNCTEPMENSNEDKKKSKDNKESDKTKNLEDKNEDKNEQDSANDEDEIILIVDQEEMDGLIGD